MLDRYTVDVLLDDVMVFQARNGYTLEQLLQGLGVRKGNSGEVFQLVGELPEESHDEPRVPSNLLYVPAGGDIEIVGAIDKEFEQNREFAIRTTNALYGIKAQILGQFIYTLNPDNYDDVWRKLHS